MINVTIQLKTADDLITLANALKSIGKVEVQNAPAESAERVAEPKAVSATQPAAPTAANQPPTIEYSVVSAAVLDKIKLVGNKAVKDLFLRYGIKSAKELKPDLYAEFLDDLEQVQKEAA